MYASTDEPAIDHHWRCRQDPNYVELRTITDCDQGVRFPVWRCRCGSWVEAEPQGGDAA